MRAFKRRGGTPPPPASTPPDLALVFDDAAAELVVASFDADESLAPDLSGRLAVRRFPVNQSSSLLASAVKAWRSGLGHAEGAGGTAYFVPEAFLEHTRPVALRTQPGVEDAGDAMAPLDLRYLSTPDVVRIVVEAADTAALTVEGDALFPAPLEATACDIARLPDGQVTLTDITREAVDGIINRVYSATSSVLGGQKAGAASHAAETRLRAALRYFLTMYQPTEGDDDANSMTAIFVANGSGSAIGFWTPARGFFSERGERFVFDESGGADIPDFGELTGVDGFGEGAPGRPNAAHALRSQRVEAVEFAVGKLSQKIAPAKLQQYGASGIARIVWAASQDVAAEVRAQMEEVARENRVKHFELGGPLEEVVAQGLLLGSLEDQPLPQINLLTNLRERAAAQSDAEAQVEVARGRRARRAAAACVVLPFVAAVALIAGCAFGELFAGMSKVARKGRAEAEAARLKPIADARASYTDSFEWMKSYVGQIIKLGKRRTAAVGLHAELDARYPLSADPTFFVSELKTAPTGAIEIKGYTRRRDSLTAFVNSLEAAQSVYANVNYDLKEGAAASGPSAPGASAAPNPGSGLAPGVVAFTITATYLPFATLHAEAAKPAAKDAKPAEAKPAQPAPPGAPTMPPNAGGAAR